MRAAWAGLVALWLAGLPLAAAHADDELEFKKVERLYLDDVYPAPAGERAVELRLRALTHHGVPVKGLRPADVGVWQDDARIAAAGLDVRTLAQTGQGMSVVLAIDASGTMRGDAFARAKDALVKAA